MAVQTQQTAPPVPRPIGPAWLRTIRFRVLAAFLGAAAAMLGAMAWLVLQYQDVSERQAMITEGYLPIAQDVDAIAFYQERVDVDIERLIGKTKRPGVGAASTAVIYSDALRQNLEEARIHARGAQKRTDDPRDQAALHKVLAQLGTVEELFARYETQSKAVIALLEEDRRDEASTRLDALRVDAQRLGDQVDTLSGTVASRISGLSAEAEAMRAQANAVAGGLAVFALGGFAFGISAVFLALRPIGELTGQVQRLAAGDYSGRVEVRGGDELAVLAGEFNGMIEALRVRDRALVERAQQLDVLTRYLSSVLDSLVDGLVVAEGGRVTLANPAARRVWSVRDGEPVPAVLRGVVDAPGRHELTGPGGTLHEIRVAPFGKAGAILVTADVTEQKRSQERLARSERLALIGQMLAQITHEVRNPLNALSLNAELLSDELAALDPDHGTEAWAVLGTVSGEIDRLTAVTAHYLALARRPPARLAPVDVGALIEDVVRLLRAELDQGGVALAVHLEKLGPRLADGNQLRQALLNVVRNATEAGARRLDLSLRAGDGVLRIALTDDGPGMTADEVERATDPFFSTKASGTGLGLAITRQILEDHGGALEVRSAPGSGTTLTLTLPDRPAAPGATPPALEAP